MRAGDRIEYLDALRGFAIIGVIITHAASLVGVSGHLRTLTNLAGNGVLLFYVISACTIFLTLSRACEREHSPFTNFFIRRLMRLLPVYWLGIVVYTGVYGLGSRGWRFGPEIWHYPLHLTLTNMALPSTMSSVVPGGWSISTEALFYLTVPLWFLLVRDRRSAVIMVAASTVIGTFITRWLAVTYTDAFNAMFDPGEVKYYWYRILPSQLGTFSFGILLFHLTRNPPAYIMALRNQRLGASVLSSAIGLLLWQAFHPLPHIPRQYVDGFCFCVVGAVLSELPVRALVNDAIRFVGRISYSGYLVHFLVLKQLSLLIPRAQMGLATTPYFMILLAAGLPLTLLLAYYGHRFVEAPTTEMAKRWITRRERQRAALQPA